MLCSSLIDFEMTSGRISRWHNKEANDSDSNIRDVEKHIHVLIEATGFAGCNYIVRRLKYVVLLSGKVKFEFIIGWKSLKINIFVHYCCDWWMSSVWKKVHKKTWIIYIEP